MLERPRIAERRISRLSPPAAGVISSARLVENRKQGMRFWRLPQDSKIMFSPGLCNEELQMSYVNVCKTEALLRKILSF
jgi:hypothetical protein